MHDVHGEGAVPEYPERTHISICLRCGMAKVGMNDCMACGEPSTDSVEYVRVSSSSQVVKTLKEAVKRAHDDFDVLIIRGDLADEPRAYETRKILAAAIALADEQEKNNEQ